MCERNVAENISKVLYPNDNVSRKTVKNVSKALIHFRVVIVCNPVVSVRETLLLSSLIIVS